MKILVTGGAGFVGGHLAEQLIGSGHSVSIIDNLSTGNKENVPVGVNFIHGDCRSALPLSRAATGCEFVYHLSSTVGVERVTDYPRECLENNIDSMRAIAALRLPGIFTSTSEVYGKNAATLREDSDMILTEKSRWSYAASKLACEWLALAARMKVVRLFNVVGPRQSKGYVFSNFVANACAGDPLVIYGDGKQTRTFMDVRDVVKVLDILMCKSFTTVNVGGAHTASVEQLALLIKSTLKSTSPIVRRAYKDAYSSGFEECPARAPDLSRLRSLGSTFCLIPLEKTIQDTAAACVR